MVSFEDYMSILTPGTDDEVSCVLAGLTFVIVINAAVARIFLQLSRVDFVLVVMNGMMDCIRADCASEVHEEQEHRRCRLKIQSVTYSPEYFKVLHCGDGGRKLDN